MILNIPSVSLLDPKQFSLRWIYTFLTHILASVCIQEWTQELEYERMTHRTRANHQENCISKALWDTGSGCYKIRHIRREKFLFFSSPCLRVISGRRSSFDHLSNVFEFPSSPVFHKLHFVDRREPLGHQQICKKILIKKSVSFHNSIVLCIQIGDEGKYILQNQWH